LKNVLPANGRSLHALPDLETAPPSGEIGSWIIASAAFMLVAMRQTYVLPALPLSLSPARFLLFLGAGLFILARLLGQRSGYRLGVLGPILATYLLSTLMAYGIGMTRESTPIRNTDYRIIVEIMLIVAVIFCFNVVHSYVGLRRVIKGLVAGGAVSAIFAILANITGLDLATYMRLPGLVERGTILYRDLLRGDVVRSQGSASHPLELAAVLTMLFPLAVGLTHSLRAGGDRWRLWAVATLTIFAGIAVSVSRSALIGLFAAFALMALYWPIRRTLAMLGGILGLAMLVFVVNRSLFEAYSSTLGLGRGDASAQYRVAAAQYILSNFSIFGMFGQAGGPSDLIFDNQYLFRLADTGIFGLLAYVLLVGTALVLALRAFMNTRNQKNSELPAASAHLFLGLAASFTAYAVMNIVLDAGGFVQIWTTMWLLLATSAVAFRISQRPDDKLNPVWRRRVVDG